MSFKWTNDISITLIELYREFECLWNPLDSKYKCRNEKHGAWVRLSDATGADISEVKRKIKNLVAQFYRERRKYRQLNKSGAGATFISKWFAYKYFEFLADKNRVRQCTEKGFNDTKESDTPESIDDDDYDDDDDADDDDDDDDEPQMSTGADEIQDTIQPETRDIIHPKTQDTIQSKTQDVIQPEPKDTGGNETHGLIDQEPGSTTEKLPQNIKGKNGGFKRPKIKTASKSKSEEKVDQRQGEGYLLMKDLQQKQKLKDNFSVFGEYVSYKIRKLKTEYAQNTVEYLISNILWEAANGKYDRPHPYNAAPQLCVPQISLINPQNIHSSAPSSASFTVSK